MGITKTVCRILPPPRPPQGSSQLRRCGRGEEREIAVLMVSLLNTLDVPNMTRSMVLMTLGKNDPMMSCFCTAIDDRSLDTKTLRL